MEKVLYSVFMLKAELHCHLEGAASPALVRRIARKYSVDISDILSPDDQYLWTDFTSFLSTYHKVSSLLRDAADYRLLTYDVFMNFAADDIIYAEIFVAPDLCSHIPASDLIDAIGLGITDAMGETGIEGRMILTAIRHFGVDVAERLAHWLSDYEHPLLTGFGLAGDERLLSLSDFSTTYELAAEAGLGLTVHAGEFIGPSSINDALDHLDVSRIGHGVRAIEDSQVIDRLSSSGVVLEVCVSSNIQLGVYPDFALHPLLNLYNSGVRLCLNSDDPTFFKTTLTNEYKIAKTNFGFTDEMLVQCTRTALESAFIDDRTRQHLLGRLSTP